jgi:uncharacterized protein YndB with AHSA1/START domain
MKTRTIHQSVTIPAPPEKVYRALMVSRLHAAFTGAPAQVSPRVGGRFSVWDGYIHGTNVELVPGKRIVQLWRPAEGNWPNEYFSRVKFEFAPVAGGTRITFTHSGVLAEHASHLSQGWKESYWEPLRRFFADKGRRPRT